MIQINHVSKHFGEKKALDDISIELPNTGFVLLIGENGSGKSTLLNTIGTLDSPSSGTIVIDGEEMTGKNENELCQYREQNIGIIFQDDNLFENMTARENINIVGESSSFAQIAESLHIEDVLDKKVKLLSGGERQRVAIARALNKKPKTILADEPTSAIDANSKALILEIFKKISKESLVIMITHDTETINYADRVIELSEGKVKKIDIINETTKANPISPYKNKFNSIKFAFSQLFTNKKQIIRSGILLIVSFVFILLATSLTSINILDMHADTMHLENDHLVVFQKFEKYENDFALENDDFNEKDIAVLNKNNIFKNQLYTGKKVNINHEDISFDIRYQSYQNSENYFATKIDSLTFYTVDALKEIEHGHKPAKTNEIVINSYIADQIIKYGIVLSNGEEYRPKSYEEIVEDDVTVELGEIEVKIAGIKELRLEKFEKLKKTKEKNNLYDLFAETIKNLGDSVYVLDDFYDLFSTGKRGLNYRYSFLLNNNSTVQDITNYLETKNMPIDLMGGTHLEDLDESEIVISENVLSTLNLSPEDYIGHPLQLVIKKKGSQVSENSTLIIKGVSNDGNIYLNEKIFNPFLTKTIRDAKVIANTEALNVKSILSSFPIIKEDIKYILKTNYSLKFESIEILCNIVSITCLVISFLFIILTFMYLLNYIFNSVNTHKKDIAVLKSLGIKTHNILNSFIIEILLLIILSYPISVFIFYLLKTVFNLKIAYILQFKVNILPIHATLLLIIFILAIIISILIALTSFKKIKKIGPYDLIKVDSI